MATTRVLLVDDEALVRQVLKHILAKFSDIEIVGEASTGDEAITSVEKLQPDVVVMDIRMPRMDGVAAAREIRHKYPDVKVIGLSEYAHGYHAHAMEKSWGYWDLPKVGCIGRTLCGYHESRSRRRFAESSSIT